MKIVKAYLNNGKIVLDFDGYENDACSEEEKAIRAMLSKMGVRTDVDEQSKKAEREPNTVAEGERIAGA